MGSVLALLAIVATATLIGHWQVRRRWQPVLSRPCQGRAWRRAFEGRSKHEIRTALALVADAFVLAPRDRLRLRPDDQLMTLYRMNNPHHWTPDALEFEALHGEVLKRHGVDLVPLWHDGFTVGDVLLALPAASAQRPAA